MFQTRPIAGFLCRFVIVFGLLIAPWPGWRAAYSGLLREGASAILGAYGSNGLHSTLRVGNNISIAADFGSFGPNAIIAFARNPSGDQTLDTIIYLANRHQAVVNNEWTGKSCAFSSRYLAYLPTALVIALILATDISWKRRLTALGWGLLLVHLFISFQLGLIILVKLSANPEIGQFQLSPFWQSIVSALYECFVEHIGTNLAAAVPIWILATFRRNDWNHLIGKKQPSAEKSGKSN